MSLDSLRANLPVGSINQVIDRMLEELSIFKPTHIRIIPAIRKGSQGAGKETSATKQAMSA